MAQLLNALHVGNCVTVAMARSMLEHVLMATGSAEVYDEPGQPLPILAHFQFLLHQAESRVSEWGKGLRDWDPTYTRPKSTQPRFSPVP